MSFYRVVAFAFLILAHVGLHAQTWPSRPVKLIVPFPPGGTGDLLGRLAAKEMEATLGQPVVVENRAGAGGLIGSDAVAKSPADGHTLVLSNVASHAIGPAVRRYFQARFARHVRLRQSLLGKSCHPQIASTAHH